MSRDVPPLPWTDPTRLWFAGSLMAFALAASAVVGIVNTLTRTWPETFTTDPAGGKTS
jgi:diadenosine tetraphosphatase ApaH/serine/threonine PP2A family protein phosphatase